MSDTTYIRSEEVRVGTVVSEACGMRPAMIVSEIVPYRGPYAECFAIANFSGWKYLGISLWRGGIVAVVTP